MVEAGTMVGQTPEVDGYLARLVPERQAALTRLRSLVFDTVPDAVEDAKYRMPTYWYKGEALCTFASQKNYMSLYMDVDLVEKHRDELAGLDVGRSCIRFRKLDKLPLDTVRAILKETVRNRECM
jgi:uncharacterized protein YdhG (YjbR/CyaY superfamily)